MLPPSEWRIGIRFLKERIFDEFANHKIDEKVCKKLMHDLQQKAQYASPDPIDRAAFNQIISIIERCAAISNPLSPAQKTL